MKANFQRWVSLGYVGCGLVAYLLFGKIAELVWDLARWAYPQGWPLTPPEVVGLLAGIATFAVLRRHEQANQFFNEAAVELSKIVYPARKETWMATGVVGVVVTICAAILAVYDVVWGWCVQLVF
jgi:preprotein translocase SecE subunit